MEFKTGNMVRNLETGSIGKIQSYKEDGRWYVDFGPPNHVCCERAENLALLASITTTPLLETYTAPDGTIYTKLKSLSPESVYAGGRYADCQEWKDEFDKYCKVFIGCHGFAGDIRLENVVNKTQYPKWLPWLIKEGYIGAEKKKEKKKEKKVAVFTNVRWFFDGRYQYPTMTREEGMIFRAEDLSNKPPMKMTLEWEE